MRKLFAMVATVAVVLSMFSGIAFAAPAGTPASLSFAAAGQKGWVLASTAAQTINGLAKDAAGVTVDAVYALELWEVDAAGAKVGAAAKDTQNTTAAGAFTLTAGSVAKDKFLAVYYGATKIATIPVYEQPKIVITSASSFVSTGNDVGSYLLQGEFRSGTTVLTSFNGTVTVTGLASAVTVTNGRFQYLVPSNVRYQRVAIADAGVVDAGGNAASAATVYVDAVYAVSTSTELNFTYSTSPLFAITGTLTDATGKVVKGSDATLMNKGTAKIGLYYVDADKRPATKIADSSTVTDAGQFSLTVDSWSLGAGDIGLFLSWDGNFTASGVGNQNTVLLKSGKVSAATDASITATPNTGIVHTIKTTDVKFAVKGVPASHFVDWTLKYGTTDVSATGAWLNGVANTTVVDANGYYTNTFTDNFADKCAGTYTVKASVKTGSAAGSPVVYEAETTFVVNDATPGYMLLDTAGKLTKLTAVGSSEDVTFGGAGGNVVGAKIKADGTQDGGAVFTYTVFVDGTKKIDNAATGTISLKGTKLGTIPVRVQVYDAGTKVLDQVYNVEVPGWNVEYDVNSMLINEAKDITFKVTDKDGNPINNGVVYINSVVAVTANTTNISNGTYVAKAVKYSTPGVRSIQVKTIGGTLKADFTTGLTVSGQKVYDVQANLSTLLLGKKDKVRLTVTEGQNVFIPAKVEMQQGTTVTTVTATSVDSNSDGKIDAIDVSMIPANTKDVTVRVMNNDGTKCGEVVLKVVEPTIETNGQFLTENVKTLLTFKVIDPRDNTAITKNLTLTQKNFTGLKLFADDKKTELAGVATLIGAAEYKIAFLATGADYTAATDAGEKVELTVKVALDTPVTLKSTFEVKTAKIVSNPAEITVGSPATLVLTYQDANGNAIVGKEVFVGADKTGISLGKTNDKGQVSYALAQSATVAFAAATDFVAVAPVADKYTKLTVPAVLDVVAPVVTAPETSTTKTATINIKDNVRVIRLMVNGAELNIIPRAELNHVVTLAAGTNKFEIVAVDNNYNVVEQTVTINYGPAAGNSTVLKGTEVAQKGSYTFVQLAKFQELGATKSWNATTKTATFTHGGKTVSVTIGSTTAKVDGASVTMPVAPYLVNGFTMVPTRFIAENLGWKVDYVAGVITITLP